MNTNSTQASIRALLAVSTMAVAFLPTLSNAEVDSKWSVKAGLVAVDAGDAFSVERPNGGQAQAGGNAILGTAAAIEYRLSDRIALEGSAMYAKTPDIEDNITGNGDEIGEGPAFMPLMAGANFRLVDSERFSIYAGPRVGFVIFGDFDLNIGGQTTGYEVDDEFAWGAAAGMSYRLRDSRWSVYAEANYLDVDMNISERGSDVTTVQGFDPLTLKIGAAFSF